MQRYFVAPEQFQDGSVVLRGEDAHHAARVMRMAAGDSFIVCDGKGRSVLATATEVGAQEVRGDIAEWLEPDSEPFWRVAIAQSLPKGDKMELVIQKGTEIGAAAFLPFQSERNVVQYDGKKEAKRLERWSKIAKEAAEQAHRHIVPEVHPVRGWKELLAGFSSFDLVLFCYERAGDSAHGIGIADAVKSWRSLRNSDGAPQILLVAGPEGGFSDREAGEAQEAGAVLTGLGKRILRAETAGIAGLTCLLYESGEMGGAQP